MVFLLGQGGECATRPRAGRSATAPRISTPALAEVPARWDELLGTVQVKTPDRALDLMLNRWLLYQTLACRIWARTASTRRAARTGSATSCRT